MRRPLSLAWAVVVGSLTLSACGGPHHGRHPVPEDRPAAQDRLDRQADEAQRELEEATE
jgi:hypothetical protein